MTIIDEVLQRLNEDKTPVVFWTVDELGEQLAEAAMEMRRIMERDWEANGE